MTQGLRKRHLYFWVVLGILLPVGWLLSVKAIPSDTVDNTLVRTETVAPFPTEIFSTTLEVPASQLRFLADTSNQLQMELELPKALEAVSVVVYMADQADFQENNARLIGQLNGQQLYRFACGNKAKLPDPLFLHFRDPVKKHTISTYKIQL